MSESTGSGGASGAPRKRRKNKSTKPKRRPKLAAPKTGKKGRQKYVATEGEHALVWAGLAGGMTHERLYTTLGINKATFARVFAKEIQTASASADAQVSGKLFQRGVKDGDVTALIYWSKARMGWRDRDKLGDDTAIATIVVDPKELREACAKMAKESANDDTEGQSGSG